MASAPRKPDTTRSPALQRPEPAALNRHPANSTEVRTTASPDPPNGPFTPTRAQAPRSWRERATHPQPSPPQTRVGSPNHPHPTPQRAARLPASANPTHRTDHSPATHPSPRNPAHAIPSRQPESPTPSTTARREASRLSRPDPPNGLFTAPPRRRPPAHGVNGPFIRSPPDPRSPQTRNRSPNHPHPSTTAGRKASCLGRPDPSNGPFIARRGTGLVFMV